MGNLKPCQGCQRMVDPSAPACPGCGRPVPVGSSLLRKIVFGCAGVAAVYYGLTMLTGGSSGSGPGSSTPDLPSVTGFISGQINDQVTQDAMKQYEIVKRNGTPIEACVHAGIVSAALVQAHDEEGFRRWKDTEKSDCRKAGMPQ